MIFVTVGTHEQGFERLIEAVDNLKRDGVLQEDIYMQIGFSKYKPLHCKWDRFMDFEQMKIFESKAKIVITHGGPSTFMEVLNLGKTPIVVPRQKKFDEHINDHQILFAKKVKEKGYPIIVVDDICDLKKVIFNATEIENIKSNNNNFLKGFITEIDFVFKNK
ncbi:glycosyltransferase [Enterococcus raffinosus]|uniref:glycosyltransferase n=1 Tax=Enterococcus raffinosus TaxID=71452 RepID=UPI001C987848|nr:glycosyltransferase [Enterococcus raffinosus]QZO08498.1 multidrug MFS transporter [Enterococcus raffinosus]